MPERWRLPRLAFINSQASDREQQAMQLAEFASDVLRLVADTQLRSPMPAAPLPIDATFPECGLSVEDLFAQLSKITAASVSLGAPGYIGHMQTTPTLASVLADLVASACNNSMLSVETSLTLSALEPALMRTWAHLFGFPEGAGGVMTAGGTMANLHALALARNAYASDVFQHGLANLDRRPVILCSAQAHTSLRKATMLLGLGVDAAVSVPTDDAHRMQLSALGEAYDHALAGGQAPFCVVATAGATTTGAVDPIAEIAAFAEQRGLWLHVDAAYGGAVVLSQKRRSILNGVHLANSLTFDPHKWMAVAGTCAMVLFRDVALQDRLFRVSSPYMSAAHGLTNLGEISIPGTRYPDVLKLWASMQHLGRAQFDQLIEHGFTLSDHCVRLVHATPSLRLLTEPDLNIVCFRAEPDWCAVERLDDLNLALQSRLNAEDHFLLSAPRHQGQTWLRAVLINPHTEKRDLDRLFQAIGRILTDLNRIGFYR